MTNLIGHQAPADKVSMKPSSITGKHTSTDSRKHEPKRYVNRVTEQLAPSAVLKPTALKTEEKR